MNTLKDKGGVWLVYDGDCPICTRASEALHLKQEFGSLHTLDARETYDDPLIDEINRRGLDLDEGMVIYLNDQFYHGKDALKFISRHGKAKNIFMSASKVLFWSDALASLSYPWMRGARNWLLRRNKRARIDNLNFRKEPTFKSIFGKDWDSLPPVLKKHYANCPYSTEVTTVAGTLDVFCKPPLIWFSPVMKLLGQIPTYNKNNVPVTVRFKSDLNSKAFHFDRCFNFTDQKPYFFKSRMLQLKGNAVIEIMRFGLGWKMQYSWDGKKVILTHVGYAIEIFGHLIPLPLTLLMGEGSATETPIDDKTFDTEVRIIHPWWGEVYGYSGRFEVLN